MSVDRPSPLAGEGARQGRRGTLARAGRSRTLQLNDRAREAVTGYLFMLPWLIGFLGLVLGPMVASLWLSLTKYDLLTPPRWIGGQNYLDLLSDPRYLQSVRVTLTYVGLAVPLRLVFALLLALVLNRGVRGLDLYRATFYVPSLLGASVAIAILWRQLFGGDGVLDQLLRLLGWHDPPAWVVNPRFALLTLVVLAIWEFGSPMVIFLAGLRQIPRELYEAAMVDGAGGVARFLRITLPLLTPLVLFNLVLQTIGSFQAFTPAYIVSGGSGGPVDSTLFYTLYLYQQAFGSLHMGYGAAMAWILLAAIAVVTAVIFASSRYWVFYMEQSR
ncbi:MAG TPA: sugar ABC transporter permease [Candidatus Dormibacteraeota bacterium]|nr:sugar ABC transporter permease [Candidatus Dormibacteraeota bacterium]